MEQGDKGRALNVNELTFGEGPDCGMDLHEPGSKCVKTGLYRSIVGSLYQRALRRIKGVLTMTRMWAVHTSGCEQPP